MLRLVLRKLVWGAIILTGVGLAQSDAIAKTTKKKTFGYETKLFTADSKRVRGKARYRKAGSNRRLKRHHVRSRGQGTRKYIRSKKTASRYWSRSSRKRVAKSGNAHRRQPKRERRRAFNHVDLNYGQRLSDVTYGFKTRLTRDVAAHDDRERSQKYKKRSQRYVRRKQKRSKKLVRSYNRRSKQVARSRRVAAKGVKHTRTQRTQRAAVRKVAAVKRQRQVRKVAAKPVSRNYKGLINKYARAYGIPAKLAHAIVRIESNYRAHVRGSAGEVGLMQIKLTTARGMGYRGGMKALYHPETNIKWGMKYLAGAYRRAGGSLCGTVLRYNAGHYAKRMNPTSARYCRKARRIIGSNYI